MKVWSIQDFSFTLPCKIPLISVLSWPHYHCLNLNFLYIRKLSWYLSLILEKIFFNTLSSQFLNHLSLQGDIISHLNKFQPPLPKDTLCKFGWKWTSGSGEDLPGTHIRTTARPKTLSIKLIWWLRWTKIKIRNIVPYLLPIIS